MRVLVFETNLLWSERLIKSLRALGHEAEARGQIPESAEGADAAIINLASPEPDPPALIARLKELGVTTIGHAGHKEKDLHELGRRCGCDILATNGQLTWKIEDLMREAASLQESRAQDS